MTCNCPIEQLLYSPVVVIPNCLTLDKAAVSLSIPLFMGALDSIVPVDMTDHGSLDGTVPVYATRTGWLDGIVPVHTTCRGWLAGIVPVDTTGT